jgi:hypothetical protein
VFDVVDLVGCVGYLEYVVELVLINSVLVN